MTKMKDVEQVFVCKDPEQEHACNQTSIIALDNGELLLGFNEERYPVHADSGQSCLIKSQDGGVTWDPADKQVIWPYTDVVGNWDCAFAQLSDGTILMHTRVCAFIAPTGIDWDGDQGLGGPPPGRPERLKRQIGYALLRSEDNGETWSDPIPVNTSPVSEAGLGPYTVGGSGAGHIIELPDGGLLMPLHGSLSKEGLGSLEEPVRCFLLRSDDGGMNWEYWSTVAYDPAGIINWIEPGMARLDDGKLVCLMRTHFRPRGRIDNMWFTYSEDDGITWSPPERTSLWGFPADVMQLQDGRVLAVYGYRKAPWGVRGCVSEDGLTWDIANEFVIREGGAAMPPEGTETKSFQEQVLFAQYWHIGYPTVAQLEDGTIVAAFHEYSDDDPPLQYLRCTRFKLD